MHPLPEARLQPKTNTDRLSILEGQARRGARTAGTIVGIGARTIVVVVCAAAGLWAIGSLESQPEERSDSMRRLDESLQTLRKTERDMDNYIRVVKALQDPQPNDTVLRNFEALKSRTDINLDGLYRGIGQQQPPPAPTKFGGYPSFEAMFH